MDQILTVTVTRVRQIDPPGEWFDMKADYYAKVRIAETWKKSDHRDDVPDWRPNWKFSRLVPQNSKVPIRIELWDHDDAGGDDECDINPKGGGKKRLDLEYRPSTGRITGDWTGTRGTILHAVGAGDSDRAEIWIRINHAAPSLPQRLP